MRVDDALDNNPQISRQSLAGLHEQLFGWCLSRCDYERPAAEDLMQQTYVEILSGRARFDARSSLKSFLFGVAQNLARSRYRRLAARLRLAGRAATAGSDGYTPGDPDDARARRVWAAVRDLPARQRDLVELVFCRELTVEEAARVMRISVGSGRVHYDRAKKALARTLADLREDERPEVSNA
jgi:RNA polymerase sigma-70 factor (ECF subfamily)